MFLKSIEVLIATALVMAMTLAPAHAYLDPGTGSILLQLLLGGVAGVMVVVKLYWHSLKETLGRYTARLRPKG